MSTPADHPTTKRTKIEIWPPKRDLLDLGQGFTSAVEELRAAGYDADLMIGFSASQTAETVINIIVDAEGVVSTFMLIVAAVRRALSKVRIPENRPHTAVVKVYAENNRDVLLEVRIPVGPEGEATD